MATKVFAAIGVVATAWLVVVLGYALMTEWFTVDIFGVHFDGVRDPILGGSWCRATASG